MRKTMLFLAKQGSHPFYPLDRRIKDGNGSIGLHDFLCLSFKGVVEIIKEGIVLTFLFGVCGTIAYIASIPAWMERHFNSVRIKASC